MKQRTIFWLATGALAAALALALHVQASRTQGLRRQVETARRHAQEMELLLAERAALGPAVPAASSGRAEPDPEALQRARSELNELQARMTRQPPAGEPTLIPAEKWTNAGSATPASALETALWAGRNGNIDTLAGLIVFDESARSRAEELFARLPPSTRVVQRSPEHLVALLTTRDAAYAAMQVRSRTDYSPERMASLAQGQPGLLGMAVLGVEVTGVDGSTRSKSLMMRHYSEGWRFVVPAAALDKYAAQLESGSLATSR